MFNDQLLEEYIRTFYGYGSYEGKYWFVGMEEGGGGSFEELDRRLRSWKADGKKETRYIAGGYDYRTAPKERSAPRHFAERPKLQRTWNMLIRILLSAEQNRPTLEAIKTYQRDNLGRPDIDNCLLELLPLPSPSTAHWLYAQYSELPYLRSRQEYMEHCAPERAKHIKQRIEQNKPAGVVFYGVNWWYRKWWNEIAGVKFSEGSAGSDAFYIGGDNFTVFVISKHPVSKGIPKDYFHQIGKAISEKVKR
jgi:hypothetical protein